MKTVCGKVGADPLQPQSHCNLSVDVKLISSAAVFSIIVYGLIFHEISSSQIIHEATAMLLSGASEWATMMMGYNQN